MGAGSDAAGANGAESSFDLQSIEPIMTRHRILFAIVALVFVAALLVGGHAAATDSLPDCTCIANIDSEWVPGVYVRDEHMCLITECHMEIEAE